MTAAGELSPDEWAVWRGFVDWSSRVRREVADQVERAGGLSFPDFEVLVRLHAAGGELGQRELLASLGWSASRLSHQLHRMSARGQLERQETGPGRLMEVRLRPAGAEAIEEAIGVLGEAVRRALLNDLDAPMRAFLAAQHPSAPLSL
jgi:DNA-binding MarR family transcriptional regulator